MKTVRRCIQIKTKGNPQVVDITEEVRTVLVNTKLSEGVVTVFVVGSTAALTTIEYEPGAVKDLQEFYDKLIPRSKEYHHDATWGDANGFSHLRAALQGPSLAVPFEQGKLSLGTWQQIILAEFDTRPRERTVIVQVIGE